MVWNQQEIGAHTGDEEENLLLPQPPPPPTPSPQRWRMFLDYKLVPDDPENTNIIWITKNNFIPGIFTLQNFILLS